MSRLIERDALGGRFLTKDAAPTTRLYYPRGDWTRTLFVDDIATKTALVIKVDDNQDGTAETTLVITTDFELLPLNAGLGPEPAPYTQIQLPLRSSRYRWTPESIVEVTATHGWPAIPDAGAQAICQLVAILRLESPRATTRISEGLDAVIGTSREARDIVDRLTDAYAKPAWAFS